MKNNVKITYALFAIALLVFAFTDLQISQAVFGENNAFGNFFETFGEVPMMLVGAFSCVSMILTRKKKRSFANLGFGLLFITNSLGAAALPGAYLKLNVVVIGLISLTVAIITAYGVSRITPDKFHGLRQISKVGVVLSLAPIVVVNGLKMLWGRERFRHMSDPVLEFTPWFLPRGLTTNNEFMSFPSGHFANGAVILWLTLIPLVFNNSKKRLLGIFAWTWSISVMFSRIVVGAHFASDVVMGLMITYTLLLILKKIFVYEN